jgi:predicted ATPase
VQVLKEQVASEPQGWLTPCQCSPYHQHTALYPLIDLLERVVLRFEREESPTQKLSKLEGFLVQYGLPLAEVMPLFAALLSLPLPADYAPLTLSPEQQKRQTLQALLTIMLRIAIQQPVLFVMEDLHWVDPSTLELLSLLVDQGPTARILALFTSRPDFSPPWTGRAHLTQVTVTRLPHRQVVEVIHQVAHGKALPPEVVEQIVAKTDGVPLFVEELTKMVLESGLLQEREECYELTRPLPPLAIPATLHDSLMARLDRLSAAKTVAQLGATIGRQFSYNLLQAVSPLDETTLQHGLRQLVEAELLYQRGLLPQATYLFKHALIQDAAYQSLLKSTRQHYHQRIAEALAERFPETAETQPELLAHHATEAGLSEQAIVYWQRAGQRAIERSANLEAIGHLTKGLEVLATLPDTREWTQQELALHTTLGPALIMIKGYGAPEVEHTYVRARELCQQVDDPAQLFPVLRGLWNRYLMRAEHQKGLELGEQLLSLAHRLHDPASLVEAYRVLGTVLWNRGELLPAREHLERGIALYEPHQHRTLAFLYGADPGAVCRIYAAVVLWSLGHPQQARRRMEEALTLARELSHPHSLAFVLVFATILHRLCGEVQVAYTQADAVTLLAAEQGIAQWFAGGTILRGWAVAVQGQAAEGIAQIHQGLAAWRAASAEVLRPSWLALLAEAYVAGNDPARGLHELAEAVILVETTGEGWYEAELHRLKGECLLLDSQEQQDEAAACFQQALAIARRQQAKSWELRAAMSLSRLWQQQGKQAEAHKLLAPIYGWFTEGFETADLQEAKALLQGLMG